MLVISVGASATVNAGFTRRPSRGSRSRCSSSRSRSSSRSGNSSSKRSSGSSRRSIQ